MSLKRRLSNLEKHETPKAAGSPEFKKILRMAEQSRQRWRDDPEGMAKKRQESLRQLGFPEGYSPSWKVHLAPGLLHAGTGVATLARLHRTRHFG